MNRTRFVRISLPAAAVAASLAGVAFADDNSMSQWTGDSYAYFNNLDYHPGRFNTARASAAHEHDVATAQQRPLARREVMAARPALLPDASHRNEGA